MKCPICGTYEVMGSASTGNPIQECCCVNGHRFKIAECYKIDAPSDFDNDHYSWSAQWQPLN